MSINLITSLNSNISSIPTQQECLTLLNESVSKEIFNNYLPFFRENGIRYNTLNEVSRGIKTLFLDCYVDHGFHAHVHKTLHDLIRNNCEHFANRCVFGKSESEQVDNILNTIRQIFQRR